MWLGYPELDKGEVKLEEGHRVWLAGAFELSGVSAYQPAAPIVAVDWHPAASPYPSTHP